MCIRRRSTAGAPASASSCIPTSRRRTPKRKRRGGGWISGRSSPTAAISTATAGCRSCALLEPFLPGEPEDRARLLAALVALALREESAGRRRQPIAAVEPVSARHHPRRQKMLAPVRAFPVSIQSRRQSYAFVLYSFGQERERRTSGAHAAPAENGIAKMRLGASRLRSGPASRIELS